MVERYARLASRELQRARLWLAAAALAALLVPAGARADSPNPAQGLGAPVISGDKCADTTYKDCTRLHFAYGPVSITPGANYQLLGQQISKPNYDGYMVRVQANMVRPDGSVPPVDELHLHHAVWTSIPQYGNYLPFYGVGEEKTANQAPHGYGLLVHASDVWLLDYMLHNLTSQNAPVYVTYDVDFIPKASAEAQGIKSVLPLWIDVRNADHPYYPVFNVQRGYGHVDPATGKRVCVYPRETCARFDPFGNAQPGNGVGYDFTIPSQFAGTLIGMGGHVHPGGLTDEVSLVRGSGASTQERRIFNSRAHYYDPGGPVSWDLAMTVTPPDWRVQVRPGDRIRLNAVYDAEYASWYEGMGIVMAWVAPGDHGGVDPFQTENVRVAHTRRVKTRVRVRVKPRRARRRARARHHHHARRAHRRRHRRPRPRYRWVSRYVKRTTYTDETRYVPIQTEGPPNHGHLPENDHHGGEYPTPLPDRAGPVSSTINIANFKYSPGDLSTAGQDGIPQVKANQPLAFNNYDAAVGIWHTVTTCEAPCTGVTGVSYPTANALPPLDSLELGYVPGNNPGGIQPVGQTTQYQFVPDRAGLQPGHVYTYFCRIHPFMRGAFKVVS